jgi:hypothetical protein
MASIIDVVDMAKVSVHTLLFKPTAIIISNDLMPIGCFFSLREPGYQVPEDNSVTDSLTLRHHLVVRTPISAPGTQFST